MHIYTVRDSLNLPVDITVKDMIFSSCKNTDIYTVVEGKSNLL